jgi:hypothetical protein
LVTNQTQSLAFSSWRHVPDPVLPQASSGVATGAGSGSGIREGRIGVQVTRPRGPRSIPGMDPLIPARALNSQ